MEGSSCEVMVYTSEIADLEKYLLGFILKWRLEYTTPFEYIQLLTHHLYNNENTIIEKAVQISELLLICIFIHHYIAYDILNNYSPYSIALASISAAVQLGGLKDEAITNLINKETKVKHLAKRNRRRL